MMTSEQQKMQLLTRFKASALEDICWSKSNHRTVDINELRPAEIEKVYLMFFPQPSIIEQIVLAEHKELLRKHRSTCLAIATRIGLKEPDSWVIFNNWMLKSSILKKRLNDYTLVELQSLERQLRKAEDNYDNSAKIPGTKAYYHKNKLPIPSQN